MKGSYCCSFRSLNSIVIPSILRRLETVLRLSKKRVKNRKINNTSMCQFLSHSAIISSYRFLSSAFRLANRFIQQY